MNVFGCDSCGNQGFVIRAFCRTLARMHTVHHVGCITNQNPRGKNGDSCRHLRRAPAGRRYPCMGGIVEAIQKVCLGSEHTQWDTKDTYKTLSHDTADDAVADWL